MFEKKISDEEKKKLQKAERKAKKKQRIEEGRCGITGKIIKVIKLALLPAILSGIIVCGIYLSFENQVKAESLKGTVLVMKQDVAPNTLVKADDRPKLFEEVKVELAAIPESAFKSVQDLPKEEFYLDQAMAKNQMLMKDDVTTKDMVMDKYKKGYEITSFKAEAFEDSVNGSLRKGDIVDVFALDPATEQLTLMLTDVYISEVYDNSGKLVTEDSQVATSFTVWVTPEEVESLNTAIVYGGVQMYLKVKC